MTIIVRAMHREDIPAVLDGCEWLHGRSRFSHMDFDRYDIEALIETGLIVPDHFFAEVIEIDGRFAGMLFAECGKSWFGKDRWAQDRWFFVLPEFRGRCVRALHQIVADYQEWALERGAKITDLNSGTGIDPERTAKLFQHLGMPQVGSVHSTVIH